MAVCSNPKVSNFIEFFLLFFNYFSKNNFKKTSIEVNNEEID